MRIDTFFFFAASLSPKARARPSTRGQALLFRIKRFRFEGLDKRIEARSGSIQFHPSHASAQLPCLGTALSS